MKQKVVKQESKPTDKIVYESIFKEAKELERLKRKGEDK
jgi:hypothetical protein